MALRGLEAQAQEAFGGITGGEWIAGADGFGIAFLDHFERDGGPDSEFIGGFGAIGYSGRVRRAVEDER